MAISPKISIKQSSTECGKVVLCDLTGAYSASNTGGYGFPNITVPGKITLTVTTPSGESGSAISLDSMVTLLTDNEGTRQCLELEPSDVGLVSSSFPDGVYTFLYQVYSDAAGTSLEGSFTLQVFFKCTAFKCANKILMSTCDSGCLGCGDNLIHVATRMQTLLNAAEYATSVGAYACAGRLLTRVNNQCDNHCTNCS